ncbi:uncharacterized protein LOC119339285 [Triticum dicoccoides]|uniref:uncharacterized protein LOC119339285 n=1 Tax=Triticum dicoccoides TaxID=85692 RepID=UPI001890BCD7|nr:uncharacterized protein LOC119339285 [Triticum dicoccoides]
MLQIIEQNPPPRALLPTPAALAITGSPPSPVAGQSPASVALGGSLSFSRPPASCLHVRLCPARVRCRVPAPACLTPLLSRPRPPSAPVPMSCGSNSAEPDLRIVEEMKRTRYIVFLFQREAMKKRKKKAEAMPDVAIEILLISRFSFFKQGDILFIIWCTCF